MGHNRVLIDLASLDLAGMYSNESKDYMKYITFSSNGLQFNYFFKKM